MMKQSHEGEEGDDVITMMRVLTMARIIRMKMRINVKMMMCTRTRPMIILGNEQR